MKRGSRGLLAGAEGTTHWGDAKAGRVRLSFNPQLRVGEQLGLSAPSSGRATSIVRTPGIRCFSLSSTATTARMARPSSAAWTPRLPCRSSTGRSNARRFGTRSASRSLGELFPRVGFIVSELPGQPAPLSISTTSAGQRSSGSRRAKPPPSGPGSAATAFAPTRSGCRSRPTGPHPTCLVLHLVDWPRAP